MERRVNRTVDNSSTSPQQHQRRAAAPPSTQTDSATNAADTTSVTQRLQKELMALNGYRWLMNFNGCQCAAPQHTHMCGGDLGVSAFPEGENIFKWIGTIEGGKGTMYEGLSFKLSLHFTSDYPFKPPQVNFKTTCFHPNVDMLGNICLDILQDSWSSAYDCRTILLSVQSLLGEPNPESPLNTNAAALWKSNKEEYKKLVQKHYVAGKALVR